MSAVIQWMAQWPAILCFFTASLIGNRAYYVPFLDNLLDTIATPLAVIAGALLANSILPLSEILPVMRRGPLADFRRVPMAGTLQVGTGAAQAFFYQGKQ
ncbi:MAG: DUF4126 domain-containing protein [Chitinophagaceae bacterium]